MSSGRPARPPSVLHETVPLVSLQSWWRWRPVRECGHLEDHLPASILLLAWSNNGSAARPCRSRSVVERSVALVHAVGAWLSGDGPAPPRGAESLEERAGLVTISVDGRAVWRLAHPLHAKVSPAPAGPSYGAAVLLAQAERLRQASPLPAGRLCGSSVWRLDVSGGAQPEPRIVQPARIWPLRA